MKILVNAISAKMGGFKTLINSFISNIDEDDRNQYYFMVYEGTVDKSLFNKKNIYIIESKVGDMNHFKRFFWYQLELPKIVKKNQYDYMINMTNYGPTFPGCKQILLLHNPKHVSQEIIDSFNLTNKLKLFFQDIILKLSLKGTDKLVVQTNYMKQGVIRKFKFPENKITIIPNAPSEIKTDKLNKELDNMLLKFLGNEKNVLSNITLYAKHKNLELLIEAIKYIKENNLCKLKLIITVDKSENKEAQELISLIEKYNLQEYVLSVGNIKHENIHQVLGKSKVFIFPSYAETLGIPFIEAMKFKLPIIAADLGFSHDVCGEAAVYFKYNDSIELAKCIVDTLNNTEKIAKMKEESRMRSYMYDEKLVVREYLNLLK